MVDVGGMPVPLTASVDQSSATNSGDAAVYDAFISYARKDREFVEHLVAELKKRLPKIALAVDTESILPAEDWSDRIEALIEGSLCVLFVVSPNSLASIECGREIDKAQVRNKRFVPVLFQSVDMAQVPKVVMPFNFIDFAKTDNFSDNVNKVVQALRLDSEWRKEHTQLLMRARIWDEGGRDRGSLLRGQDLESTVTHWQKLKELDPQPIKLQDQFVTASTREELRRRRIQRTVWGSGASALLVILSWLGWSLATTPAEAWMPTDLQSHEVVDAALIERDGVVTLAVQLAYHVGSMDDDSGGRGEIRIVEMKFSGHITDCIGHRVDEAGSTPVEPCSEFPTSGHLLAKLRAVLGPDSHGGEDYRPWDSLISTALRSERADDELDARNLENQLARILPMQLQMPNLDVDYPRVFRLDEAEYLAFVAVNQGFVQLGAVPAYTSDSGVTWHHSALDERFTAHGFSDVTRAGSTLFATALDTREPGGGDGTLGGLFASTDASATWKRVGLPEILDGWGAFYSVRACVTDPKLIALSSGPETTGETRPPGVPGVRLSEDGGTTWTRLAAGFSVPNKSLIRIIGVSTHGEVVAIVRQDDRNSVPGTGKPSGKLALWRPLNLLERLRRSYGISF